MKRKAVAKINIFLKIVGTRGMYHEIVSRFIRYEKLFDEITFVACQQKKFTIEGMNIPLQSNLIYKTYQKLKEFTQNRQLDAFFQSHKVVVNKNIPQGAGLGGGSSDAATFLLMTNEILSLGIDQKDLMQIGASIGADVPFFISKLPAANVKGIGEVIEPFEDEIPEIELFTPSVYCDTAAVYTHFRQHFYHTIQKKVAETMLHQTSKEIVREYTPLQANDLYKSAAHLCPVLQKYQEEYFLSGSGSSLFREKQ
ncbi:MULTISPECIES: 4-(cytidine 5'-diphospho)-2-C-methyl-D-erythritol kinase [unclassified Nitratiruptor]|uniref:4-(cytidine 5'-diphospho)-2-C-methyl-D-erythritol kinase n=1 Tax=unclassified Nitratiruptor TaxID=2624044 RepID=UPI001915EBEE|nr:MULTISPECIES: 4-(cytidine 5'-diphospho)-2-C-methyl-D-erythritol kinase [unclassified Nitratiruptor]BCD60777.1 4-diphosphocytidyl-2-C-methyl-D-erythritol kinase [Nitratiruptor sp. YY08-10]BCD64709.1 4-diphosphocytidyl-2-C-methyl-D-erythritol kinase [Nitratiruptor sp. YY08-14]